MARTGRPRAAWTGTAVAGLLLTAGLSGLTGLTGLAGLAGSAAYAATAPLPYTCQVLGQARTFVVQVSTDAPSRLAFGQSAPTTATVSIAVPEDVTSTIRDDLRAATVQAQLALPATVGKTPTPWTTAVPSTPLPAAGSTLVLLAPVQLGTLEGKRVGKVWKFRTGASLSGTLRFFKADGQPTSPIPSADVACALATGKERTLVQKVTVVKDTTTMSVRGRDTAEGERGKVRIRVASTYGRTPRGEVRVKLFHRGDLVSERVVELEKGTAKLRTRRLEERGWSVTAKYLGSDRHRGSRGSDKIKVR